VGFFKKIKKQFKRSVKKIEAQVKRKPSAKAAVKFKVRSTAKISREVQRKIDRTGLPPEAVDAIIASLGPVGVGINLGLTFGKIAEQIEAQDKAAKTSRKFLEAQRATGNRMGFFSSLGTSLLDLGKGLVTDVVAPTIGAVISQEVGQLTQRVLGVKPPSTRAAPAVATQPPAFFGGAGIATTARRVLGPPGANLSLLNPAPPPPSTQFFPPQIGTTGGSMIPGVRVEVPRFARSPGEAPGGSQKLQPVLLPDGTVGFIPIRKRRRMNVLNPRALNRAVRRVDGFTKFVKRARGGLRKLSKI